MHDLFLPRVDTLPAWSASNVPLGMLYMQGHTLARDDVIHTWRPTTAWPCLHGIFTARALAGVHAQLKGGDSVPDVTFSLTGWTLRRVCFWSRDTGTYDIKRASRFLIHKDYSCWWYRWHARSTYDIIKMGLTVMAWVTRGSFYSSLKVGGAAHLVELYMLKGQEFKSRE